VNPLPLAWAELRGQGPAALAIVTLVALAAALGIAASAEERAFRDASTRAAARFDLVIGAAGSGAQLVLTTIYLQPAALDLLPEGVLEAVAGEPGAASVAPVAVTDSYRDWVIVGTSRTFAGAGGVAEGRLFDGVNEAVIGFAVDLPIGHRFAPAHGAPTENRIEVHAHDRQVEIVGRMAITASPWDRAIIVPIEAVWTWHDGDIADQPRNAEAHSGKARRVPAIVVRPRSVGDAYALRAHYRTAGTVALFPAETLVPLYRLLGDARDVASAFSFAFQLLVILAVLLALLAMLAARRTGVGVLRALGAPPHFIFATIWLQGMVLVGSGVALGTLGGAVLVRLLAAMVSARTGLDVSATLGLPEAALLLLLLSSGTVLTALPSVAALRHSVGDLLRRG
jgi:putative ABC transport system permease protein